MKLFTRLTQGARRQFRRMESFRSPEPEDFAGVPFKSAVVVLGPPRGGTTIISRCIGQQSRVQSVIEPYQSRRDEDYRESDPDRLCADFRLIPDPGGSLLVKETFTRAQNVDTSLQLASELCQRGIATTLVYVCRSPLEGFDSQVIASQKQWARANNFDYSEASLRQYLRSWVRNSIHTLYQPLDCQRLLLFYERFCDHPGETLKPVMAAIEQPFEDGQLSLENPSSVIGGDPGAQSRDTIGKPDSRAAVARMQDALGGTALGNSMLYLHETLQKFATDQPDQQRFLRDLLNTFTELSAEHFPALHQELQGLAPGSTTGT